VDASKLFPDQALSIPEWYEVEQSDTSGTKLYKVVQSDTKFEKVVQVVQRCAE